MKWAQLCSSLNILWHCPSLGLEWKHLFHPCGHGWVFQICRHTEFSTLKHFKTASTFRILNNSAGVQSPPLALFIVMLLRPTWLHASGCLTLGEWPHHRAYTGHQNLFLYSSPMYSCHLFLISSASVRSLLFLSFIVPVLAWNIPLISPIFLKRSLVFPILFFPLYFFALFIEEGLLISCCYSLELCIQFAYLSLPPLPFTSLLSSATCEASSKNHFAFLDFFFFGMVLVTASCTMLRTSIHSSLGILNGLVVFLNFSLNFAINNWYFEPQWLLGLVLTDRIEYLHPWLQRT